MATIEDVLRVLEGLTAQLLRYDRSPVPGRRLGELQTLCWDLEGLCAARAGASSRLAVVAAEEWFVCSQAFTRASDDACDAIKAVGWLWARGRTDQVDVTAEAIGALRDAGEELLRSTVALAQIAEQVARDAGEEAERVRPDLAPRFAALRVACVQAAVSLSGCPVCAGLAAGAPGGEC